VNGRGDGAKGDEREENTMKRMAMAVGILLWATAAGAAPYVLLKGNQRVDGARIRATADGTIILISADGRQMTYAKGQYERAVADKPPELDEATKMYQAKDYDGALAKLTPLVEPFRYLGWDMTILATIARAHEAKKNFPKAVEAYETILATYPEADRNVDLAWAYRKALLESGQKEKLESKLEEMIKSAPPADASRALLLRGDIRAKAERLEAAVLDYLRVVMFYESEKAVLPEAYLKIAQTLEQMRDGRHKAWYQKLADEFPQSPEAAAAKGKV
jgi:tetratricopeptide (TPR) repeat protein